MGKINVCVLTIKFILIVLTFIICCFYPISTFHNGLSNYIEKD